MAQISEECWEVNTDGSWLTPMHICVYASELIFPRVYVKICVHNTRSACHLWYVCMLCPYAEWYLKYAHWLGVCACTASFRLLALPMYGRESAPRYLLVSGLSAGLSWSVGAENRNYFVGMHCLFFFCKICTSHATKHPEIQKIMQCDTGNDVGCF